MRTVEFRKDDQGSSKPVFLERRVRNAALLSPIITRLTESGIILDPIENSRLHLTWFYFGRSEKLQAQCTHANPDLDSGKFADTLEDLLLGIHAMKWNPVTAHGEKLTFYRYPPKSFVALKLQKTPELVEGRDLIMEQIKRFLQVCGIINTEEFIRSNANLKLQPDDRFDPHVSLGIRQPGVGLPEVDISDTELILKAPRLANVKVK